MAEGMTSSRPYLIRAIYEWISDNQLTPYLLVDTSVEGVEVPPAYVENNKIILNISQMAAQGLHLGNDSVSFSARFSGRPMSLQIPTRAVLAIYSKENGQGMMFAEEDEPPPDSPGGGDGGGGEPGDGGGSENPTGSKRPSLKVVK